MAEHQEDDFWDYNRQVDLEGFSSRRVYDTLARQSRNVTQTLGQQKDEVGGLVVMVVVILCPMIKKHKK